MTIPVAHPDPALPPVFVHSGWRCSSTYVWSRFRALPGVRAYYEPWHEQLATLTPERIARETPRASGLRHPGDDVPYLAEFADLLAPGGGVAGYQPRFALDDYFLPAGAQDAAQTAYVAGLVSHAQAGGQTPVLACCRTLGRIDWLRRRFGGFHVVLIRDPLQQWLSFHSLRKRPRPTYFELCQYVLLSEAAEAQPLARQLGLPTPKAGALAQRIAAVRRRLKRAPSRTSFTAFLAIYLLSYLKALPQADLVIDVDRLGQDPDYATRIGEALRAGCGLAPDFSDCRTPAAHDAVPAAPYRRISRQVIDALDARAALAAPGPAALLFAKLSKAMADAPEPPASMRRRLAGWISETLETLVPRRRRRARI
ncbi:hypothetical protein DDF62_10990 [Caulobacter radicis]|uniref:hypothetical protein n=1 Tax=Caulobacter radicis TaxID=2172650 RepID=UPI000D57AB72|nr:hypothetical protein [Caulobacter radicis]PVM89629.1 hypothetical protein DDF62_10990 [Caulobacter radicis]